VQQPAIVSFFVLFISLLIVLTSLFLYLVIRKAAENERRRKIDAYKTSYQQTVFRYLNEGIGEGELSCRSPLEQQALLELFEEFSRLIESEHVQARIRAFAETHFQPMIRKQLFHRRWSVRMNALFYIEDFQMKVMISDLERLYQSAKLTKSEEIQLLKIYAIFDCPKLYERMLAPKYPLTEFAYRLLFRHMNDETLKAIVHRFAQWPPLMQYAFIDIVGIRNRSEYGVYLEQLLESVSEEIRIRSLKAMATMGHFLPREKLIHFLSSPLWQERLMAIKVCGKIRANECIPHLVSLLSDPIFSVRSQAAQALLRMENGSQWLKEVATSADDPFARDMAREWLERGVEVWG